jgi:hypothetical protein
MKKKHLVLLLLAVGVSLMLLSVILCSNELKNMSIIGGISRPTYRFVFTTRKGGLYFNLAGLDLVTVLASVIVGIVKKAASGK